MTRKCARTPARPRRFEIRRFGALLNVVAVAKVLLHWQAQPRIHPEDHLTETRELADCSNPQQEYWTHVSSQAELPLADAAWRERTLGVLDEFLATARETRAGAGLPWRESIAEALMENPESLHEFRLVAAISDKRLYLDLSYIFSRQSDPVDPSRTLCGCPPSSLTRHPTRFFIAALGPRSPAERRAKAADSIAGYLDERGLGKILDLYAAMSDSSRLAVLEHWLMPKEVQQNEAKRRGHGAEAAIARLLTDIGCKIVPADKAINPLGEYDPNISLETFQIVPRSAGHTFSTDIVIPREDGSVHVCVMGLVQSSDPGQFGVNKSDEIVTLRRLIDAWNSSSGANPLELWGLVDGVGYSENKAGTVDKMLRSFHYFVQVKSAYKAALRAHALGLATIAGITFDMDFYSTRTREQMRERYVPKDVPVIEHVGLEDARPIAAGHATIWSSK